MEAQRITVYPAMQMPIELHQGARACVKKDILMLLISIIVSCVIILGKI